MTREEIRIKHIPNGIQNVKGKGDGKPQYQAENKAIEDAMREYAQQEVDNALKAASEQATIDVFPYDMEQWEIVPKPLLISEFSREGEEVEDGEIEINKQSILQAYKVE